MSPLPLSFSHDKRGITMATTFERIGGGSQAVSAVAFPKASDLVSHTGHGNMDMN